MNKGTLEGIWLPFYAVHSGCSWEGYIRNCEMKNCSLMMCALVHK